MDDSDDDDRPRGKGRSKGGGSSCHQCKSRRNFGALTYCTSNLDKNRSKRCRKKFCGHCLKKFYKESPQVRFARRDGNGRWLLFLPLRGRLPSTTLSLSSMLDAVGANARRMRLIRKARGV